MKYNADSSVNRYKVWLVAKGYVPVVLVVKMTTIRVLLVVAMAKG